MRQSEEERKIAHRAISRKSYLKHRDAARKRQRERAKAKYHSDLEATRAIRRAYDAKNRERVRQCGRDSYARNRESTIARKKAWRENNLAKAVLTENKSRRRMWTENKSYRFKHQARTALGKAVRCGSLVRPDACSQCHAIGKVEAHHHLGYEPINALNVIWLCRPCHRAIS